MKLRRLVAILFLVLAACRSKPSIDRVVLISIDTLRADYVRPGVTPHIESLAAEGVRFENALSPVPLTLPAHSSILTGSLPPRHGIHDNLGNRLADEQITLSEVLKGAGYETGAVVSSFVLDSRFNLSQGFDAYNDDFVEEHKIAFLAERKGDETTRFARAWIESHREDPFFLFVHYYDPHDDYSPPEPYRSRFASDPYAGEVAFADEGVGEIVAALKSSGLYDSTLVVVTGDHGEMLEEHGEGTHGYFIYQAALRVPLVIRPPDIASPRVVSEWVSLVDIAPTVTGLLGLTPPSGAQGRDLSPLWKEAEARWERRALYSESVTPNRYYGARPLFGLVAGNWKYIHNGEPELYDVERDPAESRNLFEQNREVADGMRKRLEEMLDEPRGESSADLDPESLRRLSSLGYLTPGTSKPALELDSEGDDPRDWIAFYRRHQRLEDLVNRGVHAEAKLLAAAMISERADFTAGHLQLARIETEERNLPRARKHYESALAIEPDHVAAQYNLANVLVELGEPKAAIERYRRALEIDPAFEEAQERLTLLLAGAGGGEEDLPVLQRAVAEDPEDAVARGRLGRALRSAGRLEEAISELTRALELERDPRRKAAAHSSLGVALRQAGRADEALAHYQKALALDPALAEAHNNLGSLLGSLGRMGEATEHFRQAVGADPENAEARTNLGLALRMSGDRSEALTQFREALKLRPDWPQPMSELAWLLATHPDPSARKPAEAVRLARRAAELTSNEQPIVLDTLAAAYAA
ncbi:MAG: sulfatase-like hydrolase/transferase, partial [Vicinamibacteria bacterium]